MRKLRKLSRHQFEKRYPDARTNIEYSQETQEAIVKVAYLDEMRFEGRTWQVVAKKVESERP